MSGITLDFETTSACPIKLGAYRYANDPSTRILMYAIARQEGEPLLWDFVDPYCDESLAAEALLREALKTGAVVSAFNAMFEAAISRYRMKPDLGIDPPPLESWRCTQAMCKRAAAPESLAQASQFFDLEDKKDAVGKSLIGVFSDQEKTVVLEPPPGMKDPATIKKLKNGNFSKGRKPNNRKSASPILDEEILWDWLVKVGGQPMTVREAWELFKSYCRQDVRAERELHKKLERFELKGSILESYQFDLRMNDKGVPVNVKALEHASKVSEALKEKLSRRFKEVTGLNPSQRGKTLEWLRERGYKEYDLQAGTVQSVLEDPPEELKGLPLSVLKDYSLIQFAALAKIPAMLNAACDDGYVRGTTQWHAARTGRAGGRIIQPQNYRRPTIPDTDVCYQMIVDGWEPEWFADFWPSPLEALASSIRHFIQPHEGTFYSVDFTGVENRIAAWIVEDEKELARMVAGDDMYKHMAVELFGVGYDAVTKEQRTIAKPIVLGCIAEGQLVATPRGLVAIEKLKIDDCVWDGEEWVSHEGVIFKGWKEVITYQGVTATPDHQVFVEGERDTIAFGEAKSQALRLQDGRVGGAQIRKSKTGLASGEVCEDLPLRASGVQMRVKGVGVFGQSTCGEVPAVSVMSGKEPKTSLPSLVDRKNALCATPLSKPQVQCLQTLRRSGDRVPFQIGLRSSALGFRKSGLTKRQRDRPHRQRRTLRTGELTLGNQKGTSAQHAEVRRQIRLHEAKLALLDTSCAILPSPRSNEESDTPESAPGHPEEIQELEKDGRVVRVYDVVNAGPRHRFTVSGKLVHNCQYGVGGKALKDALAKPPYFVERSRAECNEYVKIYRDTHTNTVAAWRDLDDAARKAVLRPGKKFEACNGRIEFLCGNVAGVDYLTMKLPSGRRLYYPEPKVKRTFKPYDEEEMELEPWKKEEGGFWVDQVSYFGKLPVTGKWGRIGIWGSRWLENICQAIGVDLLNYGCWCAEQEGFDIRMIIHDEILAINDGRPIEQLQEAFCRTQPWAEGFPLGSSGEIVKYYTKD